jgi:hypothetical protein
MAEEGLFFAEEKKQKTFMSWSGVFPALYAQETKVFFFFSSEKKTLPAISGQRLSARRPDISLACGFCRGQ